MIRHLAGRYRPLNWVLKSGHVTITKIENLLIVVEKFTDSKNAILLFFSMYDEK